MKSGRILKSTAVVGAAALILGAFIAGPADAKKKKRKKTPPVVVCAPITPYEAAADAKTTVVTDAATAEAPVTLTVPTSEGLGFSNPDDPAGGGSPEFIFTSHAWNNVQVDTAGTEAYLYASLEFPGHTDYDLLLRGPDGVAAFYSAGGPPYVAPFDGTGHGGHSEGDPTAASENIDGALTADCAGYSVDVSGATTPGGDVTLKLWLGAAPAV